MLLLLPSVNGAVGLFSVLAADPKLNEALLPKAFELFVLLFEAAAKPPTFV